MRKLLLIASFCGLSLLSFASGNKYKVDNTAVDQLFAQSEDVSMDVKNQVSSFSDINMATVNTKAGGQTVGGYLIRCFFCGFVALHRSYMGTGGQAMWWFYLCVPIAGQVDVFVDFWWVVFKGKEAMNKYSGNDHFFVWAS